MRVFNTYCKDEKTGYEMMLSECSFNQAMNWLEIELLKENNEIIGVSCKGDVYTIHTAPIADELSEEEQRGLLGRDFFYDEERGYLLGE